MHADATLAHMGADSPELLALWVARTPDPEAALAGWLRFQASAPAAVRQALSADPSLAEALLVLLSNSEFLSSLMFRAYLRRAGAQSGC